MSQGRVRKISVDRGEGGTPDCIIVKIKNLPGDRSSQRQFPDSVFFVHLQANISQYCWQNCGKTYRKYPKTQCFVMLWKYIKINREHILDTDTTRMIVAVGFASCIMKVILIAQMTNIAKESLYLPTFDLQCFSI